MEEFKDLAATLSTSIIGDRHRRVSAIHAGYTPFPPTNGAVQPRIMGFDLRSCRARGGRRGESGRVICRIVNNFDVPVYCTMTGQDRIRTKC